MKRILTVVLGILFTSLPLTSAALGATYYLSPSGSDSASGTAVASPWKTFTKAFATMKGADELILLDGTYSEGVGTGYISYVGTNSAQPPSGTGRNQMTVVRALNPGRVTVNGSLFIGRSTRKDSYIKIQGITFEGGADLYNTNYVYLKDCGIHSTGAGGAAVINIGTNDHDNGNTYILLEDCWIWGQERAGALVYRSDHVVLRRVVVRNDGCPSHTSACGNNSGNYMLSTTVYNSSQVSFQNVIAVNSILGPGGYSGASDFSTAWHTSADGSYSHHPMGQNEWLGVVSLNSEYNGFYPEVDSGTVLTPTWTYRDIVAWAPHGFALSNYIPGSTNAQLIVENATLNAGSGETAAVYVGNNLGGGTIRNTIIAGSSSQGYNSAKVQPAYMDVYGFGTAYASLLCSTGCKTSNPQTDGTPVSLTFPVRIEVGSALKTAGYSGGDIGANIIYRYGTDGAFYGETNYNTLSAVTLWPWPNEGRIKAEMSVASSRGFAANATARDGNPLTLTRYVWEYLGKATPSEIYAGQTISPPATPGALAIR